MVGSSVDVFRLGTPLPARVPGPSPRRARPAEACASPARRGRTRPVRPHRYCLNLYLLDLPHLSCSTPPTLSEPVFMLCTLPRRHQRPYRGHVLAVRDLQRVAILATLYLPSLNADSIHPGAATGDTGYTWRVGGRMPAVATVQV